MISLAKVRDALATETQLDRWEKTSTTIYHSLCRTGDVTGKVFALSFAERSIGEQLAARGQPDRARKFLRARLSLIESLHESHPDLQDLVLARALTMMALGNAEGGSIASLVSGAGDTTAGSPRHTMLMHALAEWTTRTFGLAGLGLTSGRSQRANLDETAQVQQAVRFLSEQNSKLGLDPSEVPAIAWQMRVMIMGLASNQRFVGDLEGARGTVRLLSAFAAECVRNFPGRAEPYLLVSEAHVQRAKNASKVGDRATVGQALRASLEMAAKAATVDPSYEEASFFVLDRRERLARYESEGRQVSGP